MQVRATAKQLRVSARKVRLLTGLIGWDRDSTGRYLRLLWGLRIRVGGPR